VKQVTGTQYHSLYELRKLGHPYAVRWPANYLMDDRILNKQSGEFNRSIRRTTRFTNKGATITVWAASPKGKFMVGTALMRPRDFMGLAMERAKDRMDREQRLFLDSIVRAENE
jgi:hypothetical protein